jgi:hypothetical protein
MLMATALTTPDLFIRFLGESNQDAMRRNVEVATNMH